MASYLNHVAAKALGQSTAVQPRVPTLFESPPALRSARLTAFPLLKADSESRLDSGDSVTTQPDWRFRNLIRREAPVASGGDEPSGSERQTLHKDQPPVSRITGHKRREAVSIEPAVLSVEETEHVPRAPDSRAKPRIIPAVARRTEQVQSDASDLVKSADSGITAQRRKDSPATEPRSESTSRSERDVRDFEPRVSTRPEVQSVTAPERAEVVAQSLRPAPQTPTFPRAEARDSQDTDRGFNVSVVIGRVNVQAVLPQPGPVRLAHSAPAPLLSLEQYLKQRGGHS
jgi:hypothetical protein